MNEFVDSPVLQATNHWFVNRTGLTAPKIEHSLQNCVCVLEEEGL